MDYKQKHCVVCSKEYTPTGRCSKYCPDCSYTANKRVAKQSIKNWAIKKGIFKGVGRGSTTGKGKENHMYKHGRCVFRKWARERKLSVGLCEHCGKNIREATYSHWVGHHKDHNPNNNTIKNLVLLCKQCHQIEHQCWKAFEGVTTIPQGSRVDNNPKRLTFIYK